MNSGGKVQICDSIKKTWPILQDYFQFRPLRTTSTTRMKLTLILTITPMKQNGAKK